MDYVDEKVQKIICNLIKTKSIHKVILPERVEKRLNFKKQILNELEKVTEIDGGPRDPALLLMLLYWNMSSSLADTFPKSFSFSDEYPELLKAKSLITGTSYYIIKGEPSFWYQYHDHDNGGQGQEGLKLADWDFGIRVIPDGLDGAKIRISQLDRTTRKGMEDILHKCYGDEVEKTVRSFQVGLWPISRDLHMTPHVCATPIIIYSKTNGTKRAKVFRIIPDDSLSSGFLHIFTKVILPQCEENKTFILMIPELTMSPEFLEKIQDQMRKRAREK